MNSDAYHKSNFRAQFTLLLALLGLLVLSPFTLFNLYWGDYVLTLASGLLVALFVVAAWRVKYSPQRYKSVALAITPSITVVVLFAFYRQGAETSYWLFPSVIVLYLVLSFRTAVILNVALCLVAILIATETLTTAYTARFIAGLVSVSVFVASFVYKIDQQQLQLLQLAQTDPLTGLLNRALLMEKLKHAAALYARSNIKVSLICLDLDHFKRVNDQLGHTGGDITLQQVAEVLQKRVRLTDFVFRIGGEEFLLLLFNADELQALEIAESLRQTIESHPSIPTTASFGVCELRPDWSIEEWLKSADKNLYQSKNTGRNRVTGSSSGLKVSNDQVSGA